VTDTERDIRFDEERKPGISNLLMIYAALDGRSVEQLVEDYAGRGYGDLKKDLAEVVADFVTPFRNRVLAYLDDPGALDAVLATGAAKAKRVAAQTLTQVYDRVGFLPAPA
jgi:tryptophanyl-tRNA synthetase